MGKKKNFYVTLYILIPLIFSGITVLGIFAAYQLAAAPEKLHHSLLINIYTLSLVVGCISFAAGLLILRLFLKPLSEFVEKAKKMPVLYDVPADEEVNITDDLSRINQVFESVANILGKVEARELFPEIIGPGAAMRNIFTQIIKAAPTDSTVLITGESGTGKELIADSIYKHSLRKNNPFITINCVAIPEGLLESELFGHEKGAFTGATAQKKGKFELADGGTIFLDEIGDMPPATQAKLLRVLQEKKFERVGGSQTITVDVRFLAATNKNPAEMIKTGAFREDLFYRLNVLSIHLPPLRERMEDIPFLVEHFIKASGKDLQIHHRVMQALIGYGWPGNVRELQNVIERAAIFAENTIEEIHLPPELTGLPNHQNFSTKQDQPLDQKLIEIEKGMIIEAISRAGGVQARAANLLGINQRSLWHRVKKYNIDVSTLKNTKET